MAGGTGSSGHDGPMVSRRSGAWRSEAGSDGRREGVRQREVSP
jgi:hypothetical protein